MIPRNLIRTVPAETTDQVEGWWDEFCEMHPTWDHYTFREPLDPKEFPITSRYWSRCKSGAQKAGLVRLEAVWQFGGVYVDSDVQPFRPFDSLLGVPMFAAWEDVQTVPDAVFGAESEHPALVLLIDEAINRLHSRSRDWRTGPGAWSTGPGVFTSILPGRDDVLLLPPGSMFEIHYTQKDQLDRPPAPYEFARHHWHASWLPNQGSGQ